METVIRNVSEIDAHDRQALEHVVGHAQGENQQVEIRVANMQVQPELGKAPPASHANGKPVLPEWWNVYAGLSDGEIAELEKSILPRADLSRPSE